MVLWSYPPTPRQLATTAFCFAVGLSFFPVGAHMSFSNIVPQQERVKARREFMKDRLRKFLDD